MVRRTRKTMTENKDKPYKIRLTLKNIAIVTLLMLCLFNSKTLQAQTHSLDYFISQAKSNSPLLKDYRNQILSNRLDSAILRASLRTQVNFLGSASYAPIIKGWGYD